MTTVKILAMSDIHSRLSIFERLLTKERIDAVDKVVLLGDYVGYGTSPEKMVYLLLELKKVYGDKITLLKGNWEELAYGAITGELKYMSRSQCEEIIKSRRSSNVITSFTRSVKATKAFLSLYNQCRYAEVLDLKFVFAHAGVSPDYINHRDAMTILKNTTIGEFLWDGKAFAESDFSQSYYIYIVGHIPFCFLHDKPTPYVKQGHYINIDFRASSKYGNLGYFCIDTDTGAKAYKSYPVDQKARMGKIGV